MTTTTKTTLPHGTIDSATLADNLVKLQEQKHANPDAFKGYHFPMKWFMDITGGFGVGWMCFIYGKAGIGKSSVLTTAASRMGEMGKRFLYITLEETNELLAQRMFANIRDINRIKFRDIKLDKNRDWPKVYEAANEIKSWHGYYAYGLFEEKPIVSVIQAVDPDIVYVDYLQLMNFPGKSQQEQTSKASKFLLRVSKGAYTKGKPVTVIAGAQLNDDNQVLYSRDPDRDGDLIIEIAGIDNGAGGILPGERELIIRKFRHGELGRTRAAFNGSRSLVGELYSQKHMGAVPPPPPISNNP